MKSERVLILGAGPLARAAADVLDDEGRGVVLGFVEIPGNGTHTYGPPSQHEVLGDVSNLNELVKAHRPDKIVVALTERRARLPLAELLAVRSTGVLVEDWVVACQKVSRKLNLDYTSPSHILFMDDLEQSKLITGVIRLVSLAISAIGLAISAAFLFLPIAILIKLESKGPVFFTQRRVGRYGRVFKMYKFRTMRCEASDNADVWSRDDGERVTRLGRFLRQFYFDEIPQLYNVLIGDMNLVGPRPEMAINAEHMNDQVPYFALRNLVRPGLTGWAQVNTGYSVSRLAVTDKAAFDLYYVKNRTLWFDLLIICRTFGTVLCGWHGGAAHAKSETVDSDLRVDTLVPTPPPTGTANGGFLVNGQQSSAQGADAPSLPPTISNEAPRAQA